MSTHTEESRFTAPDMAVDHIRRVARETAEQSGYRAAGFAVMELRREYRIMPLKQKEAPPDRLATWQAVRMETRSLVPMAMGAHGAWTGSVWLTTAEAETNPIVKEKMLAASSRDTVRSKSRTGKPSRQLRSPWTDAWEAEGAPKPLPMPLQSLVSEPALRKVDKLSEGGHEGAKTLATYWVGQGVGLMNEAMGAGQVVQEFKQDWIAACERLNGFIGE